MIFKTLSIGTLKVSPPSITSGCVIKVANVDLLRAEVEELIALLQEALA